MLNHQARTAFKKARGTGEFWRAYLRNRLLERGLTGGRIDYTRFVLLARSRVGSNFLRGLLNSHNQITVFGELFQNPTTIPWAMPGYRESASDLTLIHRDTVRFMETRVYRPFPDEICAVGFKLFYYHARDDRKGVWDYLRHEPDIKVIHLKRRNILKTHLSRQKAALTDQWVDLGNSDAQSQSLTLDYDECKAEFERTRAWEEEADRFFSDHPKIEVIYEDLARSRESEMIRIQDFLGVMYKPVTPETFKQARQPLSQAILNYSELKERFSGTPWAEFFSE